MSVFPSVWELLLPNWNFFTVLGIVALVIGGVLLIKSKDFKYYGFLSVVVGVVLVWGVSIIEDFFKSKGGLLIFWGVLISAIVGFLLFYEPKRGGGK